MPWIEKVAHPSPEPHRCGFPEEPNRNNFGSKWFCEVCKTAFIVKYDSLWTKYYWNPLLFQRRYRKMMEKNNGLGT